MRRVAVGGYAAAVIAAALLRELSRPGEATAQFIPSSALVYSSVNLRPGPGRTGRAVEVSGLLRTGDFLDDEDDPPLSPGQAGATGVWP